MPLPYYEEPPESPLRTPKIAARYPFVLATGGRISFFFNPEHRQLAKLRKAQRDPVAEIHPENAARFSIANGTWMWIETPRGRIRPKAKVTDGIDLRVIHGQHGLWLPEQPGPE
jgi:anaerobic selenocysteine-containing dehydrogenase